MPINKKTHISNPAGSLFIIPTPIGNLKDITFRAVEQLSKVSLVICESTLQARKLLTYYGIKTKTYTFNDHSKPHQLQKILDTLNIGQDVALVSDAGTPLISDPGQNLVKICIENHINVIPLPGPCAAVTAMSASNLMNTEFMFIGFLPLKGASKIKLDSLKDVRAPLIFYESPKRVYNTVKNIYQIFGNRKLTIARELTKVYEEIINTNCTKFLNDYQDKIFKGEIVLIVEGNICSEESNENLNLQNTLQKLLVDYSLRDAVNITHILTKANKKEIYQLAINLKN